MRLFKKILKSEQNITKYKIGLSVPLNKKANKIVEDVIREIRSTRKKRL